MTALSAAEWYVLPGIGYSPPPNAGQCMRRMDEWPCAYNEPFHFWFHHVKVIFAKLWCDIAIPSPIHSSIHPSSTPWIWDTSSSHP